MDCHISRESKTRERNREVLELLAGGELETAKANDDEEAPDKGKNGIPGMRQS